jgi:membrane associated rhomboid family serine protease
MQRPLGSRPGKVITTLLALNVVAWVLEVIFIRLGFDVIRSLGLSPSGVFERGFVWQPLTHMVLHHPGAPSHLLFNMLFLWLFGTPLESWWGGRRVAIAYVVCGLGGAALTLSVGLISRLDAVAPALASFWEVPHVGASGAIMGLTVSWGIAFANQRMNFLLLGEMTGKTFVLIIIAFELLVLLSLEQGTSSSSHFGGMAAAVVLCKGLWRPSRWRDLFVKRSLTARKKRIEHELRVIEGGKGKAPEDEGLPSDPKKWN